MQIGHLTLEVAQPEDAEHKLLSLTGCSIAELRTLLPHICVASSLASALIPFLKDPPPMPELAQAIAEAGIDNVRAEMGELYGVPPAVEEPVSPDAETTASEAPLAPVPEQASAPLDNAEALNGDGNAG